MVNAFVLFHFNCFYVKHKLCFSKFPACPEIANENDSEIELSSYNTSVGVKVVIGCKGFGRHVSDPTNVVCLDTGAWSDTPNLKCKSK